MGACTHRRAAVAECPFRWQTGNNLLTLSALLRALMTFFLTTLPLWLSAVILIVPTTLLAMAGPVIVRRYIKVDQLRTNNEVAGFKFATVGVLYAVLLAFAVVVVWEKFNQAESEVAKEAGAAATLFRLTQGVDPERGAAIREATTNYLRSAIASDWPAMESATQSSGTTEALSQIYGAILKFQSLGTDERLVLAEILRQVDRISEARREWRVMADGIVPAIVWVVLFGGAFLTVGFTFFFGADNLRAQSMMTGALSILMPAY